LVGSVQEGLDAWQADICVVVAALGREILADPAEGVPGSKFIVTVLVTRCFHRVEA
jgi:hypothetical protein